MIRVWGDKIIMMANLARGGSTKATRVILMVTSMHAIVTVVEEFTVITMMIISCPSLRILEVDRIVVQSLVTAHFMVSLTAITMERDGTMVVQKNITIVGLVTEGVSPLHRASLTTIVLVPVGSILTCLPPEKKL